MRILRSRVLWATVVLLGLLALWRFVVADWLAKREWEAYEREAKARGVRWTLGEYRPAPVAADDDVTLLPLFKNPGQWMPLLKTAPHISRTKAVRANAPRSIDWTKTRQSAIRAGLTVDPSIPDDVQALTIAASAHQPLIDQLWASKAVAGNWADSVWTSTPDGISPYLEALMGCPRLLTFRASLDLAGGRTLDSRRSIEAQFRLARVPMKMPTMIANLVSMSAIATNRDTVWNGLSIGAWDDDSLREFAAEFLSWNTIEGFQWSLATERAWVRPLFESEALQAAAAASAGFAGSQSSTAVFDGWITRISASRPAWRYDNQLWYERAADELASMLEGQSGTWQPIERKYAPSRLSSGEKSRDLALAATALTGLESFLKKAVWEHAQNRMTAIACGLELSRRRTGKYPDSLESLTPADLPSLPVDPATGGPFRYQIQPDGSYLLYSLGFDRIDQQGKVGDGSDRGHGDPDWPSYVPSQSSRPR